MSVSETLFPFPAYGGDDEYIFASYAQRDRHIVFPIIADLHRAGYRIWYEEGAGTNLERWAEAAATALVKSSLVLLFVSPNANRSTRVGTQVNYASSHRKPILVVYIAETSLRPELEFVLQTVPALTHDQMPEGDLIRSIIIALPSSLRGPPGQEDQSQKETDLSSDVLHRKQEARTRAAERAENDASIVETLTEVLETREAASFEDVTIRGGTRPREIEVTLDRTLDPFEVRELVRLGWAVGESMQGARLVVDIHDDVHLREVARNIREASESLERPSDS